MSAADARAADAAFARYAAELRPGLAAFLKLPRRETPVVTRARMAEFLQTRFAFAGQVTLEDLAAAGFTDEEITTHFHEAKRIARLSRMPI